MTAENQKRRDFLTEIETIVHETLASQPMDDADCGRCGRALDRGLVRIAGVVQKYKAEWPEHWQPADRPPADSPRTPTPSWLASGRHG